MRVEEAKRIIELMREKKISQVTLAKNAGITQAALSQILTGKTNPSLETFNKILTALNANTVWVLHGIGRKYNDYTETDNDKVLEGSAPPDVHSDDYSSTDDIIEEQKELVKKYKLLNSKKKTVERIDDVIIPLMEELENILQKLRKEIRDIRNS